MHLPRTCTTPVPAPHARPRRRSIRHARALVLLLLSLTLPPLPAGAEEAEDAPEGAERRIIAVFHPREEAMLASLVSAPVLAVHHQMGDAVTSGEPLLTLDATIYRAELRKAEAELRRAEERLAAHKRLFDDGSVTRAEYEESRAMAEIARADLAIRRHERDACEITAPYDARVAVVHVHAHEVVEPGRPLVEILDDRVLYAVVLAPSTALPRIRPEASVPVRVRETGAVVRGTVSHIGARVDPASATAKVRIRVENDGSLRAGMRGVVRLADLAPPPVPSAARGASAPSGNALPPGEHPPEPHE